MNVVLCDLCGENKSATKPHTGVKLDYFNKVMLEGEALGSVWLTVYRPQHRDASFTECLKTADLCKECGIKLLQQLVKDTDEKAS
jgi:hypothetical protein